MSTEKDPLRNTLAGAEFYLTGSGLCILRPDPRRLCISRPDPTCAVDTPGARSYYTWGAGVVELADTVDSKSTGPYSSCRFESDLRHQLMEA